MFYVNILTIFILLSLRINAFLGMPLIPVYDLQTEKRFLFPEEFLRMVLERQVLLSGGDMNKTKLEPLDEEGYVINEDGQLIPFKLYKKGMCFLHPRNCRGGFHKRELVGLTAPRTSDSVYEVEVYKKQLTRQKRIPIPAPRSSELAQIHNQPADRFADFSPWDGDIDIYEDDDDSNEDRYSFIDKKR